MLGNKNRHIVPIAPSIVFSFLMFLTFQLNAQKPKIETNAFNLKSVKRQYREHFRELGKEQKRLKSLLKRFESVADTAAMDQILQSFSKANGLVNEGMPTLDKALITDKAEEQVPERYKKKYGKLNQQWLSKKQEWQKYARQDSALKEYWTKLKADTVLLARAEEKLLAHLENQFVEGEFPGLSEAPLDQMKSTFQDLEGFTDKQAAYDQLTDGAFNFSDETLKSLSKDAAVGPLAKKDGIVEDAHNMMSKLKQKYSFVQNSNDLSTAIKSNSLQNRSFSQRLRLGGNFQFHPVKKGLRIDLSPTLAYGVNKDLAFGLGVSYRASFGKTDQPNEPSNVLGARVFGQQSLFKGFFLHAEGEFLSTRITTLNTEESQKQEAFGFLTGLGREFSFIEKLDASVLWLYHFNHSKTLAYKSPWVFRLGFSFRSKKD